MIFISHSCACLWHYVGFFQKSKYDISWLEMNKIHDESNNIRYIAAIYWVFTTMTTIGYGDITPQNPNE